ncbi:hypothetical protein WDW86_18690 [Bdellovibrionota bacterium FG-2]
MEFDFSTLAAGFVFGVFGFYLIKHGKKAAHIPSVTIGLTLLAYPYFITNPYLVWGLGFGLLYLAYRLARY